jgi:hypothetical protein
MTPTEILDSLGDSDASDEACAEVVDRLVTGFDDTELRAALRGRLADLRGARGSVVLRLVEAYADEMLAIELAEALADQPDLPPDRAWEALMIVQGMGLLEAYPELAERLDEIDAIVDEGEVSLDELARQLDEGEENLWIALQGLSGIEPSVRIEIVRGLAAREPMTRGIVSLLQLLARGSDPVTRDVAAEALWNLDVDDVFIPLEPAREIIPSGDEAIAGIAGTVVRQALVSSLDSGGRGRVILVSQTGAVWPVAVFTCDVMQGIVGVTGRVAESIEEVQSAIAMMTADPRRLWTDGAGGVAVALLAGSLMLGDGGDESDVHDWLQTTLGTPLAPLPIRAPGVERDEGEFTHEAALLASRAVLGALPEWIDESEMMDEFAEELLLREERSPDPERNSGAYRFLFENRLLERLELDRRMLIWMAIFWRANGERHLADAAVRLAEQLADEQNAVPGHPFIVELTTRSLIASQKRLEGGSGDPGSFGRIAGERGTGPAGG